MNSSAHTPQMKQKFRRTVRPIQTSFLHEFLGCRAIQKVERHLHQLPWCQLSGFHALGARHTKAFRQQRGEDHVARKYTETEVAAFCERTAFQRMVQLWGSPPHKHAAAPHAAPGENTPQRWSPTQAWRSTSRPPSSNAALAHHFLTVARRHRAPRRTVRRTSWANERNRGAEATR